MQPGRVSRYVFLLFFWLCGASGGHGQPLRLQLQLVDETVDGMPSRYIELTGPDFVGKRYPAGLWTLAAAAPPDASVRFIHRFQTQLVMDFSVFDRAELLEDYSEQKLKQYLFSLQTAYAGQGLKLEAATAAKAPAGSLPFMGGTYWKIDYKLVVDVSGELFQSATEFVSVDENGRNFRLRFSGPAALLRQYEKTFAVELGRFALD